jgi:uncharacterized membrane protein
LVPELDPAVFRDPAKRDVLVQIAAQLTMHQGILPHPEVLERYEKLIPGSAERLLKLTESQTHHRQSLEKTVVDHEVAQSSRGFWGAVVVTMGIELISALLVLKGFPLQGSAMGGVWLVGLAGVFVYGTRSRKAERVDKAKVMAEQLRLPFDGDNDPDAKKKG